METKPTKAFVPGDLPELDCIVSNDDMRPALNHIVFQYGEAVATDAHVLTRVHITDMFQFKDASDELDFAQAIEGKAISGNNWKVLRQMFGRKNNILMPEITVEGLTLTAKIPDRLSMQIPLRDINKEASGQMFNKKWYPEWQIMWNQSLDAEKTPIDAIGLNPRLLNRVFKVMGNPFDGVQLYFIAQNRAIFVTNPGNNIQALVMPTMANFDHNKPCRAKLPTNQDTSNPS